MGRPIMYSPEVRERAVRLVSVNRPGKPGTVHRASGGAPLGVGGDLFDRGEVRLFVGDAAQVGPPGRAGPGSAGRVEFIGAGAAQSLGAGGS